MGIEKEYADHGMFAKSIKYLSHGIGNLIVDLWPPLVA